MVFESRCVEMDRKMKMKNIIKRQLSNAINKETKSTDHDQILSKARITTDRHDDRLRKFLPDFRSRNSLYGDEAAGLLTHFLVIWPVHQFDKFFTSFEG